MKILYKIVVLPLCLFLGTLCYSCINDVPTGADIQVGDHIPQFSVTMNDGSVVTDSSLAGNPAVIVFFNTGCPDCQHELPVIERYYQLLKGEKSDICLICISRAEEESSVAKYWKDHDLSMPYSAQKDRQVYELFASTRIPRVYEVNSEGVVVAMWDDRNMPSVEDLQEGFAKQ